MSTNPKIGYSVTIYPPAKVSEKKKRLLVPGGPAMDGAYIDENGHPRFFDPWYTDKKEDEYINLTKDGLQLVPAEMVYILKEGEVPPIDDGVYIFPDPTTMKTTEAAMVKKIIQNFNGVQH